MQTSKLPDHEKRLREWEQRCETLSQLLTHHLTDTPFGYFRRCELPEGGGAIVSKGSVRMMKPSPKKWLSKLRSPSAMTQIARRRAGKSIGRKAVQPERAAAEQEAQGGIGLHGREARNDALERRDRKRWAA